MEDACNGRGSVSEKHRIQLGFDDVEYASLWALAREKQRPVSTVVREMITEGLHAHTIRRDSQKAVGEKIETIRPSLPGRTLGESTASPAASGILLVRPGDD